MRGLSATQWWPRFLGSGLRCCIFNKVLGGAGARPALSGEALDALGQKH